MKTKAPCSNPLLPLALVLFAILALTGCIEESTVVKINKDGSGVIHTRKYENTAAGAGLLGGLGGGADDAAKEEEIDAPTEEELAANAKAMGEGVTFKSLHKGKNSSGWTGYEVIYAFKDINKVGLDLNMKNADDLEGPEQAAEAPEKDEPGAAERVTFEMKDGVLKIRTPDPSDAQQGDDGDGGKAEDPAEGARDPFADEPENARMMAMMAPMFAGAKIGFFVQIDGGIAETNAKHRKDDMITIMRADLGKLFANPAAIDKMEDLEGNSREEAQKIIDSIEGVDMDLQDPITVRFK